VCRLRAHHLPTLARSSVQAAQAQARADLVERALGHLAAGSAEAAVTLRRLLRGVTTDAIKLGAARAMLDLGVKVRENVDQELRLAVLEQHLTIGRA
jgi:hypothetical protein